MKGGTIRCSHELILKKCPLCLCPLATGKAPMVEQHVEKEIVEDDEDSGSKYDDEDDDDEDEDGDATEDSE